MTLSLNEVDALAKKAARGAGFAWGIAEDTGKAVRWLCAAQVDGCAPLALYLAGCEGADVSARIAGQGNLWSAKAGRLCPLLAGVSLSDRADMLKDRPIRLEHVAYPILLAPFAGLAAQHLKASVVLAWDAAWVATDGQALALRGETGAPAATVTARLDPGFDSGVDPAHRPPTASRAAPSQETLAVLNRLAHRTYAPATEASRLSGAGGRLADND